MNAVEAASHAVSLVDLPPRAEQRLAKQGAKAIDRAVNDAFMRRREGDAGPVGRFFIRNSVSLTALATGAVTGLVIGAQLAMQGIRFVQLQAQLEPVYFAVTTGAALLLTVAAVALARGKAKAGENRGKPFDPREVVPLVRALESMSPEQRAAAKPHVDHWLLTSGVAGQARQVVMSASAP